MEFCEHGNDMGKLFDIYLAERFNEAAHTPVIKLKSKAPLAQRFKIQGPVDELHTCEADCDSGYTGYDKLDHMIYNYASPIGVLDVEESISPTINESVENRCNRLVEVARRLREISDVYKTECESRSKSSGDNAMEGNTSDSLVNLNSRVYIPELLNTLRKQLTRSAYLNALDFINKNTNSTKETLVALSFELTSTLLNEMSPSETYGWMKSLCLDFLASRTDFSDILP